MVLIPISGYAPQPLKMKLKDSDTVARVRQYRAGSPEDALLNAQGTFFAPNAPPAPVLKNRTFAQ